MARERKHQLVGQLDERIVDAAVRRIEARIRSGKITPEWGPLTLIARARGVSRSTAYRIIKRAGDAVRKRQLSRKLVLFNIADVDKAMERAAAEFRPRSPQPRSADSARFVSAASA